MLIRHSMSGFSLIEAMVALGLLLAGLAGASLLLLQCVQYERESSNRRVALRFMGSLAEELRALRPGPGAVAADDGAIEAWIADVESALPAGSHADVEVLADSPARYSIHIAWPVAGGGMQRLTLAVVT